MATQTESAKNLFDEAFENLRKTAESNLEMQQEMFRQWSANWPGFPKPQEAWLQKAHKFQKDWAKTAKELLQKHREVLDEQYQMAVDSLEEAFTVVQSSDPQDFAERCQTFCRKSLDAVRDAGELQAKEMQESLNKWIGLAVKSAS
jgi:exonuclease VII large subunit